MESLIVLRQKTKGFFMKYEMILIPAIKFVLMMAILLVMNWHLGYRYLQMRWILVILVSLIASILPWEGITILSCLYLLGHVSALSLEGAALLFVAILGISMLHYLFLPGGSILLALVPLAFYLKIPYMIPLIAGVFGGTLAFIPIGSGVLIYYMMLCLENNAGALLNPANNMLTNLQLLIQGMNDKRLYIALCAFCLVTLLVYGISRIHVDYSRFLAVAIGGAVMILIYLIGGFGLGVEASYGWIVFGCILGTLIALAVTAWFDVLDFRYSEYLEFEDDDYMYYVKAVPKIRIIDAKRTIHDIGSFSNRGDEDHEEDFDAIDE